MPTIEVKQVAGYNPANVPTAIRRLSRTSRLMSLPEVGSALGREPAHCEQLLEGFVRSGEMRTAQTEKGHVYYWLVEERY